MSHRYLANKRKRPRACAAGDTRRRRAGLIRWLLRPSMELTIQRLINKLIGTPINQRMTKPNASRMIVLLFVLV